MELQLLEVFANFGLGGGVAGALLIMVYKIFIRIANDNKEATTSIVNQMKANNHDLVSMSNRIKDLTEKIGQSVNAAENYAKKVAEEKEEGVKLVGEHFTIQGEKIKESVYEEHRKTRDILQEEIRKLAKL